MKTDQITEPVTVIPESGAADYTAQAARTGVCLNCEFSETCAFLKENKMYCEEFR